MSKMDLFCLERVKKVLIAHAEAEKIRKVGEAEAKSIEAVGKAEAEKMKLKAEAYQQYGDAAQTALVLEALPKVKGLFLEFIASFHKVLTGRMHLFFSFCMYLQIAGKVAAPLSKTNEIVILSGESSKVTGEVTRLLAELPVTVNALTGVDLSKVRADAIRLY